MDLTGQTALITGASSGIGAVFAEELASRGVALILVARRRELMEALASRLRANYNVDIKVLLADLTQSLMVEKIGALEVDILINNAGFGVYGDFASANPERLRSQAQLNVMTVLDLTRSHLPGMLARGKGVIINVASAAALLPMPHMAIYAASKAFVLSFTEAIWKETRHTGVRVLTLVPGPTDTPFHATTGSKDSSFGKHRSPVQVVATALRALDRDVPSVVDGHLNALLLRLPGFLPRRVTLAISERAMRPR